MGKTQQATIAAAVFVTGVAVGAASNIDVGSPAVVEATFVVVIVAAMLAGYLIGRAADNAGDDARSVLGRAIERHRVTTGGPAHDSFASAGIVRPGGVRLPIVTRPGDPVDDDRPIPGPTARRVRTRD